MAFLSGSSAIPYQVHSQFLGGIITNAGTNAFHSLPVTGSNGADALDVAAGAALRSGFSGQNGTVIQALNYLDSQIVSNELAAGVGIDANTFAAGVINLSGSGLAEGTVAVGEDGFIMLDLDGTAKQESLADLATGFAGDGLAATAGVLAVQVGTNKGLALTSDKLEITGSAIADYSVAVGADEIVFLDADGTVKKDTVADLMTAAAGDGLAATAGVLAVQVGTNKGLALTSDKLEITGSAIADYSVAVGADEIVFLDADGTVKKDTVADLATAQAGNGIAASSGQFSIDGSDPNTWSGVQKYGVDKLYVSGTNAVGQPKYFSFKVDGGVLVLSEQNA